jgi:DNA polymerase-1
LILYRCSSATEHVVQWDEDNFVLSANIEASKDLVVATVAELRSHIEADEILVCISDTSNFRKAVTSDYKSNRKEVRKPLVYRELRKWFMETYPTVCWPNLEADDMLGILSTTPGNEGFIVASEDKDLMTIPGKLWRQKSLSDISPIEADRFWMLQTLTGDVTDGYKGCPGMGPAKAAKVLDKLETLEDMLAKVVATYIKQGLTADDALLNARLARILRYGDYDNGNVKLWEPKGTEDAK